MNAPPKSTYSLLETILADPELMQRAAASASISLTVTLEIDANGLQRIDHPQWRDGRATPYSPVRANTTTAASADSTQSEIRSGAGKSVDEGFVPSRSIVTPGKRPLPDTEYRLVGKLGSGGTGIVYQAHQRAIDREVAVKVLRDELACDPIARQRFLVEARTIGSLDHPNVIALHELATGPSSELFYSMKRIDGTSWDRSIDDMTFEENLETILRLCDAIRYAHSRELIHRDIKPENVMLGRFGEVLLADWGLALSLTSQNRGVSNGDASGTSDSASTPSTFKSTDSVSATSKTVDSGFSPAHAIGGTPAYMAPELAAGDASRQSKQTDIYLLGALLYRILTGHPPHYGDNLLECIRRAAANEIRPTSIRSGWIDVAMKAMATEPEDRFQDVAQFAAALAREKEHERSVDLLRRAEKVMKKVGPAATHQDFGVAEALIREALDVWPGNRQAAEMLVDLQTEHARSAAAAGDFDLALELLHRARQGDSELAARVKMKRDSRREQAIRESKFSRLFTQSPDAGLMTRWGDGEIIEANNMFEQLTGFEPSAVVGRKIIDLNLWACKDRRTKFVEVLSDSGYVADFETPLFHREGHRLDVSLCASRVEMNGESFILTTMRDISLRVQARQELDRSRQRLRDMQRLAQLGTWELNVASGKVRWSDETYKIAGLPTDHGAPDLHGYLQTVHPDDRGKLNAAIENTILYRTAYELRLRHARPDGAWNTVIARGQPMLGDQGQVVEIYGVVLDITRYASNETNWA
jgi:PAS domain S-box-containing protein